MQEAHQESLKINHNEIWKVNTFFKSPNAKGALWVFVVRRSRNMFLLITLWWVRKLKNRSARRPKGAPQGLGEGAARVAPGGMGPWSGSVREVKLDSRSKNHEARSNEHEKKHES